MTTTRKSPKDWTPEEKLQAVLEAAQISEADLGAFLRKKGIHESHLKQWRQEMLGGLQQKEPSKKGRSAEAKRIRQLERELTRKEKALAEAAALLVLKKKVQEIWGDEDDKVLPDWNYSLSPSRM